jgi:hypothetical protein
MGAYHGMLLILSINFGNLFLLFQWSIVKLLGLGVLFLVDATFTYLEGRIP